MLINGSDMYMDRLVLTVDTGDSNALKGNESPEDLARATLCPAHLR